MCHKHTLKSASELDKQQTTERANEQAAAAVSTFPSFIIRAQAVAATSSASLARMWMSLLMLLAAAAVDARWCGVRCCDH
jgi:hypothetical protein